MIYNSWSPELLSQLGSYLRNMSVDCRQQLIGKWNVKRKEIEKKKEEETENTEWEKDFYVVFSRQGFVNNFRLFVLNDKAEYSSSVSHWESTLR